MKSLAKTKKPLSPLQRDLIKILAREAARQHLAEHEHNTADNLRSETR
ncbi:MAG: hypothetical protein OJF50_000948 [Nitrospira sp.]|nr:hypothetical protein [Nitrospira sp.]